MCILHIRAFEAKIQIEVAPSLNLGTLPEATSLSVPKIRDVPRFDPALLAPSPTISYFSHMNYVYHVYLVHCHCWDYELILCV